MLQLTMVVMPINATQLISVTRRKSIDLTSYLVVIYLDVIFFMQHYYVSLKFLALKIA